MPPDGRDPHGGGGDDVGGSAEGGPVHHEAALDLRIGESCRYRKIYTDYVQISACTGSSADLVK